MKVVMQGNPLNLDISHVEVDEEREVLVIPIMDDAINLEINLDDLRGLRLLADHWLINQDYKSLQ